VTPQLLPADAQALIDRGLTYNSIDDSGMTCVVISSWQLPSGLDHSESDLLLRLPAGFPDVAPDMWWFSPAVRLANGGVIPATEVVETHLGREWQRWSRHLQPGQWQSGVDALENYLALIQHELLRCAVGVST
jgi:hypothetical protein